MSLWFIIPVCLVGLNPPFILSVALSYIVLFPSGGVVDIKNTEHLKKERNERKKIPLENNVFNLFHIRRSAFRQVLCFFLFFCFVFAFLSGCFSLIYAKFPQWLTAVPLIRPAGLGSFHVNPSSSHSQRHTLYLRLNRGLRSGDSFPFRF